LTGNTVGDVIPDVSRKARPIKVAREASDCFGSSQVTSDGDVVGFLEKGRAKVGGDVETVVGSEE
jgi:hypothetical protein